MKNMVRETMTDREQHDELQILRHRVEELESLERDHRKLEADLRFYGHIIENIAEGIHLTRISDGCIVYVNPTLAKMFGYAPEELLYQHVSILNAPDEKLPEETALEIISSLHETGAWDGVVHNVRKDGSTFWCHANVSIFSHAEFGEVWITTQEDITHAEHSHRTRTPHDTGR